MRLSRRAVPAVVAVVLAACSSSSSSSGTTTVVAGAGATTAPTAAGSTTSSGANTPAGGASSADTTPAIVAAAQAFLATLTPEQRTAGLFEFSNTAQRQRWSNLPQGIYQRSGLMWGNLSSASQDAWLTVMRVTLSKEGYDRVLGEWNADEALATQGGGGPGGLQFGKKYYWVALMGAPSTTTPWQWQWGGHHVTVNATISGTNVALTPSFIGAQPTSYNDHGTPMRPLGDIESEALALVSSLDTTQATKAVLGTQYIDLVLGPGQDGKKLQTEGLAGSAMTATQQAALAHLIGHYIGLVNDEDAAARTADITAHLADTYFAWYGATTAGTGMYFRISGPTIVVEYSSQSMGGDPSQHIHGIYRDPTNDYGTAFGAGL